MNENAGKYVGMTREECREALIKDLKDDDLLIKIEEMTHSVGHSERTDVAIEPYLSKQWFVKMRPLADRVLSNQKNKDTKVNFVPSRFEKVMNHWMEITYDWCISRQLWWGHRIPAWYRGDEVYVGEVAPEGEGWVQDTDVLDTWFSSALWPFSTLGWPEETEDIKRYYPNDVLVTGYDIIPFWVNRMTFQGLHFTDSRPFKDCLIHGLIRDKEGRKMSKSLGKGVDPMDVINEYGCDSLRYFLSTSSSAGMDLRYDEEKIKSTWNFINKLWNASRYVLMNLEGFNSDLYTMDNLSISDKWILTRLNETIKKVRHSMNKYEFNNVGSMLYSFIWDDFCDWYIELSKIEINNTTKSVLLRVLTDILKMLHPIMPYVTEEIYSMLPIKDAESIMVSSYPKESKKMLFEEDKELLEKVMKDIISIRNLKANNNITKKAFVKIDVKEDLSKIYRQQLKIQDEMILSEGKENLLKINYNSDFINITYYYEGEVLDENKIQEEIDALTKSIERRKKLLANENYVNKAPKNIVDMDRKKLEEEENRLKKLM